MITALNRVKGAVTAIMNGSNGKKVYLGTLVFVFDGLTDFLRNEITSGEMWEVAWLSFMIISGRSAIKKIEGK